MRGMGASGGAVADRASLAHRDLGHTRRSAPDAVSDRVYNVGGAGHFALVSRRIGMEL
jgi:hypothetical protein